MHWPQEMSEVLGRLAAVLPASKSLVNLQLAMERRCPAKVPDLLVVTIGLLLLVVTLLAVEAAWACVRMPEVQLEKKEEVWPSGLIKVKEPMDNFKAGYSCLAGNGCEFMLLYVTLMDFPCQRGVQKS